VAASSYAKSLTKTRIAQEGTAALNAFCLPTRRPSIWLPVRRVPRIRPFPDIARHIGQTGRRRAECTDRGSADVAVGAVILEREEPFPDIDIEVTAIADGIAGLEDMPVGRLTETRRSLPFKFRREPRTIGVAKGIRVIPTDLRHGVIAPSFFGIGSGGLIPVCSLECHPSALSFVEYSSRAEAFSVGHIVGLKNKTAELRDGDGSTIHQNRLGVKHEGWTLVRRSMIIPDLYIPAGYENEVSGASLQPRLGRRVRC
jgi:hypothetical protein